MATLTQTTIRLTDVADRTTRRLRWATLRLLDRRTVPSDWYFDVATALQDGHVGAWRAGRHLAGDLAPNSPLDVLAGQAIMDEEAFWLQRFVADLEAERYVDADGRLRVELVQQRLALYVSKLRGTANQAFVEHARPDEVFEWRLGAVERHCDDCPRLAAMSPWARDELFTYPSQGGTPCLGNCKCILVRASDGMRAFAPLDIEWPNTTLDDLDSNVV